MVTMQKNEGMHRSFIQALEQAKRTSLPVLVSIVTKLTQTVDPLAFFVNGKRIFKGERAFWADPKREVVLVGLGSVHTIRSNGANNRFEKAEQEWKSVLATSIIVPNQVPTATGPVLIGGFSFDPLKKKTSLWNKFSDTQLVLPQFMLTVCEDGQMWFTSNSWIHETDDIIKKLENTQQIQAELLAIQEFIPPGFTHDIFQYQDLKSEAWMHAVDQVAAEIRANELDKVVLARELRLHAAHPFIAENILYRLQEEQSSSYLFAIESETDCFLGASPERLVKRQGDRCLSTCLAGTIVRGKTIDEDKQLGEQLLNDQKNLHEHAVVVSMIQTALADFCEAMQVPDHPVLYKVRDIQHLYTPVVGRVKSNVSILSLVARLHPTPALGGFPKELAMQKIREHEVFERGFYGAPVGWVDSQGNGEFAVAIRSGLIRGEEASLFAGCGIVGKSDSYSEYKETQLKFRPMISALGGTWNGQE